jgi:hypothetical protein
MLCSDYKPAPSFSRADYFPVQVFFVLNECCGRKRLRRLLDEASE